MQKLIDELPTADELAAMSSEERQAVYNKLQAAYEAYDALTDEQKAVAGAEIFDSLFDVFNGMVNTLANQKEYDLSDGSVTISDSCGNNCPVHTITGSSDTNTITVTGGAHNITLNGVTIDVSGTEEACALDLDQSGTCTITLQGSNVLKSGKNRPGIRVPANNNKVTINGDGSLEVRGGYYGPGIGCGHNNGNIEIKSGTIYAYGGGDGAGIGGSRDYSGGTITIYGGKITATGGGDSAGIGGGYLGNGGNITIEGGEIKAIGTGSSGGGAGIGGGGSGGAGGSHTAGTIIINGGTIEAISNGSGAGIGGGHDSNGGTITINGGTVTASGSVNGAGIGGGHNGYVDTITINGGIVTATGGSKSDFHGAAIGNGGPNETQKTFNCSGDAVIFANCASDATAISDKSHSAQWRGVIIENKNGQVYGTTVTPTESFTVPSDTTVIIPEKVTLEIGTDIILTNNGTIKGNSDSAGGTLTGSGELTGTGTIAAAITNNLRKNADINIGFDSSSPVYGDTIKITAEVSKVQTNALTRTVEQNKVDFFVGADSSKKSLGTAVVSGNTATLSNVTITAGNGWTAGANTITAEYGGSMTLNSKTGTAILTVTKAGQSGKPTVSVSKTKADSITVSASGSGQGGYEYACVQGENASAPTVGWQTDSTFGCRAAGTAYTIFARYAGNKYYEPSPASDGVTTYTAAKKPATSDVFIDYTAETISFAATLEVNTAENFDRTAITSGDSIKDYFGSTLYVRVKENGNIPASEPLPLAIPSRPAAPSVSVNYGEETLSTTTAMQYASSTSGQSVQRWENCGEDDMKATAFSWDGSAEVTVKFRSAATDSAFASAETIVTIPARLEAPDTLQGKNETYENDKDGGINGVSSAMEYRLSTVAEWTPCTSESVTGLAPGTYLVRYQATDSAFASGSATVEIRTGEQRTYTLNVTAPAFDSVAYSYTQPEAKAITINSTGNSSSTISSVTVDSQNFVIGGSGDTVTAGGFINTWTIQPAAGLNAGTHTATITVSYTGGAEATAQVTFAVNQAEQAAPDKGPELESRDRNSITLKAVPDNGNGAKAEYSRDGGASWQDSPIFEGLSSGTKYSFVVRYGATTDGNYAPSPVSPVAEYSTQSSAGSSRSSTTYYKLTFDTNGGSKIDTFRTSSYGWTVDLSGYTTTREGFGFNGWYSDAVLTNRITEIRLNGNKTVYAGWIKQNPETGIDNPFTDVKESDWFYNDVMVVYGNGLMSGTSSTTFGPNAATTRAQLAVIFYRLDGSPAVEGKNSFTDVEYGPGTAWYYNAVTWAQQKGVAASYEDGSFHPDDPITREQLAMIFCNYAKYKGYHLSAASDLSGFADAGEISPWALDAVKWAVGSGLMNSRENNILDPKGTAIRAEVAAMLHKFIENKEK